MYVGILHDLVNVTITAVIIVTDFDQQSLVLVRLLWPLGARPICNLIDTIHDILQTTKVWRLIDIGVIGK
ncbi:hypothetical protein RRF57_013246 [Xylaria bambusicola]|uniref:Uncharacterized protein n=1 Tax=Xylaria bambusicola TaxID=326684 RepID=A0AAN7V2M0_9PEZI